MLGRNGAIAQHVQARNIVGGSQEGSGMPMSV